MKNPVRIFLLINSTLALSQLHCDYKIIEWLSDYAVKCNVLSIEFTPMIEGDATIEQVNGSHIEGFSDENVRTLSVKFKNVEKIPQSLTNFYKNLVELEISHSNLRSISGEDLIDYGNLTTLSLSGNLLTTLSTGLFDFTPNLEYIDFSYNRIKHVDTEIFDAIPNLNRAFFEFNVCTGSDPVYGNNKNEVRYFVEKYLFEHCKPKSEN